MIILYLKTKSNVVTLGNRFKIIINHSRINAIGKISPVNE